MKAEGKTQDEEKPYMCMYNMYMHMYNMYNMYMCM